MKLVNFEIEVLKLMLAEKYSIEELNKIISTYEVSNFEYTGAGYFLELKCNNLDLERETIHAPLVMGKRKDLDVGFLLFVEKDAITIECHSWGDKNPPADIRELQLEISLIKL
jgi:hypothetical protein